MNKVKVFEVCTPLPEKRLIVETILMEEAEREVKRFYAAHGVICDMYEYEYVPTDMTLKSKS